MIQGQVTNWNIDTLLTEAARRLITATLGHSNAIRISAQPGIAELPRWGDEIEYCIEEKLVVLRVVHRRFHWHRTNSQVPDVTLTLDAPESELPGPKPA